jgi:hypothetical protein
MSHPGRQEYLELRSHIELYFHASCTVCGLVLGNNCYLGYWFSTTSHYLVIVDSLRDHLELLCSLISFNMLWLSLILILLMVHS